MSRTRNYCATLIASVFLLVPSRAAAQSLQTLDEQLKAIGVIATPGQTPPGTEPEAGYFKVITAFAADPWNCPAPTSQQIQATLAKINLPIGFAQSATGAPVFSESAIIGGLTDFVVNRAKDEATVSFLLDLRDRIKADPLLSVAFKQTLVVLQNLETDSAKQLLNQLRSALTADLRALPQVVFENDAVADALKSILDQQLAGDPAKKKIVDDAIMAFKQNRELLRITTSAVRALIDGKPVLASVADYATLTPPVLADHPQVRYAFITAGVIVREYRWAPNDTRVLLSDPLTRSRFLALVVRDLTVSQSGEGVAVASWAKKLQGTEGTLNEFLTAFDETNNAIESVKHAATDTAKSEAMADVANALLHILAAARPFAGSETKAWDDLTAKITHVNHLQVAIVGRDYVTALTDVGLVLNDFQVPFPPTLVKTLTFSAALATAQTSEDVTTAIEAAALPVLSYRTKRAETAGVARTWIGVNAYLGGSIGFEHTTGTSTAGTKAGFGGLTLPIGIEVGRPLSSHGSFSVFVPLIDVGTVASFRFKQTDTQQAPAMKFSQVVAPGVFAVIGITQRYPLSAGFGAQFVPSLRLGTDGSGPFNVVRFGAFAAIDVPIFRF